MAKKNLSQRTGVIERGQNNLGKIPICGCAQKGFEVAPIEPWARVELATWGNVFVSGNSVQGVVGAQLLAQRCQLCILNGYKGFAFEAFELNANRKVVAVVAPTPLRGARVPSSGPCGGKLLHGAVPANHKMARHLQPANLLKVGVSVKVELIGEQLLDFGPTVLAGWQADGVHHHQVDGRVGRAVAHIG